MTEPQPAADEWAPEESVPAAEAAEALAAEQERFLRLAAEYQNYRKRTEREKLESFDRGASSIIVRLLDVLDDVERLAQSQPQQTSYDSYRDAFDLIVRKLRKELETAGLERLDPSGETFDPTVHEAVAAAPATSPELSHTVKATFQTGYRFKGNVVRPAKVQVYTDEGMA